MFNSGVKLLGEIRCSSLFGLKFKIKNQTLTWWEKKKREKIINETTTWLSNKFSLSVPQEMNGEQYGEYLFRC